MTLLRLWNPTGVTSLQREMNRMFDDYFDDFGTGLAKRTSFNPRINITEKENEYRIDAELPGMDKESINLSVSGDALTISGEKKEEKEEKKDGYQYRECSYGSFSRTIPLPENANMDSVDAKFNNGVLTVTLPKKVLKQEEVKKIEVK